MNYSIRLEDVGVVRGGNWLLRGVSWKVRADTTAAVIGPNGCGKTTLMRVICGYTYPSEGGATVAGFEFGKRPLHDMRRRVRLVAAAGGYDAPPATGVEDVALSGFDGTILFQREASADERDGAAAALNDAGVAHLAGREYGTLSTGERTRVQLARALVTRPAVLLLDEPALGLDIPGREALLHTLESLHGRLTLVVVTHHPEELPATVGDVLLMRRGRIHANGPADEVLTDANLTAAYGVPLRTTREGGRVWVRVAR